MIIGISAKIGCGKTYLASLFLQKYPKYIKLEFGYILKKETSMLYNYPEIWNYSLEGKSEIINRSNLPKQKMSIREILQWHGTDLRRSQDPGYWVKQMEVLISIYSSSPIIIDDVRFKNEVEFIKGQNGLLIRINPYREWKPGQFARHKSETDLDNYHEFDLILTPKFGQLEACLPLMKKLL